MTNILLKTLGNATNDYWMTETTTTADDATIHIKFDRFVPSKITISAGRDVRKTTSLTITLRTKIDLGNFTYKDIVLFNKENASLNGELDPKKNNKICKPNTFIFTREDFLDSFN